MKASSTTADCAASVVQPKTLPPKQRTLTSRSVRPSLRVSIVASPPEYVGHTRRPMGAVCAEPVRVSLIRPGDFARGRYGGLDPRRPVFPRRGNGLPPVHAGPGARGTDLPGARGTDLRVERGS